MIPSNWKDSSCGSTISLPRGESLPYRQADIVIDGEHPFHKQSPYTQQSRSCGQSGDFVALPFQFLRNRNQTLEMWGDPAKVFVHEFAKFRYGIFDEFGFNHDRMYPNYYYHQGEMLPTGTTNVPVKGSWVNANGHSDCDPKQEECFFKPSANDNNDVTCSLGYLHFLPKVTKWCDAITSRNVMAPTKHNILCQGKSALEVIMSHDDFTHINVNKAKAAPDLTPEISIVRDPLPHYVLVLEKSAQLDLNDQWKWINKAAQKFIRYDLPVNSNLGIFSFSEKTKMEQRPIQITGDDVRTNLADIIPEKYHLSSSNQSCVSCAIESVVRHYSIDNLAGIHIILLTRGSGETLSTNDEHILKNYILDYNIKLSSILLPSEDKNTLPIYDDLATAMGAKSHVIQMQDDQNIMDYYVSLTEAFTDILRSDSVYPTEMPETVHKKGFVGDYPSKGSFIVDHTLGRDTEFGIFVENVEEHRIKSILFTDSKGVTYGPFNRMSSTYELVNFKTINYPTGTAPPFNSVSKNH